MVAWTGDYKKIGDELIMADGIIGSLYQIIGLPNNFAGEIFAYAIACILFIVLFVMMFLVPMWLLKRY